MLFNLQSFGFGFISGFATGVIARELTSVTASALKPVARAVTKTSVLTFEKMKESVAHMGEAFEDIVAEVRSETASISESAGGRSKKVSATKKAAAEAGA